MDFSFSNRERGSGKKGTDGWKCVSFKPFYYGRCTFIARSRSRIWTIFNGKLSEVVEQDIKLLLIQLPIKNCPNSQSARTSAFVFYSVDTIGNGICNSTILSEYNAILIKVHKTQSAHLSQSVNNIYVEEKMKSLQKIYKLKSIFG